jgi:predicted nucleic acid-binding protein
VISPVFVDTSALYEVADRGSPRHGLCAGLLRDLLACPGGLLTTELVLAEIHALVLHRFGPGPALVIVKGLVASPRIEIVAIDAALRTAALSLLGSRPGRAYSLADAASFATMARRGVSHAFTLDMDFAAEGFTVLPDLGLQSGPDPLRGSGTSRRSRRSG